MKNCRLEQMFFLQQQVLEANDPIEAKNGSIGTGIYAALSKDPPCIDRRDVQSRIREHFERYVEEMAEAFDARSMADGQKYVEELVDCFKFLVNMYLVIGIYPPDLVVADRQRGDLLESAFLDAAGRPRPARVDQAMWACVGSAAHACSYLRNTSWRQTEKRTELQPFRLACYATFQRFVDLMILDGVSPQVFYDSFLKKTEVNHDRIASRY